MSRMMCYGLLAVVLVCLLPVAASAHERREVGKYLFVVGFLTEPAYVNEQNGVSIKITNTETGRPVRDLADALKVQVVFGSHQRDLALQPVIRDPGHYKSDFYPTTPGAYTFRISGEIEGTAINESFTSSPDGFHEVTLATDVEFPPTGPSAADLTTQLATAQSTARTGIMLGSVGLGLGLLSLIVALLALRRRGSAPARHDPTAARA